MFCINVESNVVKNHLMLLLCSSVAENILTENMTEYGLVKMKLRHMVSWTL